MTGVFFNVAIALGTVHAGEWREVARNHPWSLRVAQHAHKADKVLPRVVAYADPGVSDVAALIVLPSTATDSHDRILRQFQRANPNGLKQRGELHLPERAVWLPTDVQQPVRHIGYDLTVGTATWPICSVRG